MQKISKPQVVKLQKYMITAFKGDCKDHVPTKDNPRDQGSRSTEPCKMGELWFKGPDWLSCLGKWPQQPEVSETAKEVFETAKESVKPKFEKQLLAKEEKKNPIVDQLLNKYASYQKLLRITAIVR